MQQTRRLFFAHRPLSYETRAARAITAQASQRSDRAGGRFRGGLAVPLRGQRLALQALAIEPDRFGGAQSDFLHSVTNLLAAAMARRARDFVELRTWERAGDQVEDALFDFFSRPRL